MSSKESDKQIELERKEQEDRKKFKTAPKCQLMWDTKKMRMRKKNYNDKKEKERYKPGNSIKT